MPNITLKRFMIFNSSEGHHESQEGDKLLYHWTKDAPDNKVSLTEQIDDICLCDASVNVSFRLNCNDVTQILSNLNDNSTSHDGHSSKSSTNGSFKPNENGRSLVLNFDTTVAIIVEVEPKQSIWMAIHVAPQSISDQTTSETLKSDTYTSSRYYTKTIESSCFPVDAIERVMNNIYARFCLLNGNFQMISNDILSSFGPIDEERRQRAIVRDKMRAVCEEYFNNVLPEIHLNSVISNVASLYNYIIYLNLNAIPLMKVNSFINHLVCVNAFKIRHTIVIFNDQLLWSSLNLYDTRLLYNYLVSVLIRDALQEELTKEVEKVRRIKEDLPIYLSNYENECETTKTNDNNQAPQSHEFTTNLSNIPLDLGVQSEQFLRPISERKLNKLYLTVFRSSNNMTLGLIFSEPNLSDLTQKCEQILTSDSRLGVIPLASLAQSVGQNFLRASLNNRPPQTQATHFHHHQHHHHHHYQSLQQHSSNSSSSIKSASNSTNSQIKKQNQLTKSLLPLEQKYIHMNRLDVSISWPLSMDMMNKEHLLLSNLDSFGLEIQPSSKKLKLIKYLIELEPEMRDIKQQTGSIVEEFLGKTTGDLWITVTNSKYRTIYSIHNLRNSSLSEAQQSAINIKSILAYNRM